ncbi:MAG: 3D-(3,5/4)-trihydroxycyclohexane-1,2-dione acylhydrolase (decyclizing), partial [Chlamydiia bacterium]|nr:3D-(3,5/4)-trihydroxycyclohexane-1,2-dione acylhydrolase (decyclizing) [Chlamydiia bacterium]
EDPCSPLRTANSCLEPVSRYYDVITRPEQILSSAPRAVQALLDPSHRGAVTLALPQDVQTEAYDYPLSFFAPTLHSIRRPQPDGRELGRCAQLLTHSKRPFIVAGGGVHYSGANEVLRRFAEAHAIPVAETQAGKGALKASHCQSVGGLGVTGTKVANALAQEADCVLCVGTRLSDFTTASKSLFANAEAKFIGLNLSVLDANKLNALPLIADIHSGLQSLSAAVGVYRSNDAWQDRCRALRKEWTDIQKGVRETQTFLPTDTQVVMAVNELAGKNATIVCAAGGLPGELHRHWNCVDEDAYHLEYGFSCMGYEIAGGLGVKMAKPDREVYGLVGDGSYLMLHTELVTSLQLGLKLNVIVLDNHGFGCINRLQQGSGCSSFGNKLQDRNGRTMRIDFAANARSYGCHATTVRSIRDLTEALQANSGIDRTCVTVIETDGSASSQGYAWWDVAIPEVSAEPNVQRARADYCEKLRQLRAKGS